MPMFEEKAKRDQQLADLTDIVDAKLSAALDFTAHDLAANRLGYMSKRQFEFLRRRRVKETGLFIIILVLLAGLICYLPASLVLAARNDPGAALIFVSIFTVLGLILLFLFKRNIRDSIRSVADRRCAFEADLQKGDIAHLTGIIELDIVPAGRSRVYQVKVEDRIFHITSQMLLAFKNDEPYRLYYAPNTTLLLAAEPFDVSTDEKASR